MSSLIRSYIRNILTEISRSKMVPGNKAWEEYQQFIKFKEEKPEGMHGFPLFNRRGRAGKKWFNKHADQNWLNGPVENIVVLHNPALFSYKAYHDQKECARDMIRQYRPGAINKNEMSAYGLINKNAATVDTHTFLKNTLPNQYLTDALGPAVNKRIFLHLSPRRITQAAIDDSSTNTYHFFPKIKPIGITEWQKLDPVEFFKKYDSFLEPDDRNNLLFNLKEYQTNPNQKKSFNDIKKKYEYLRTNNSYSYDKSFETSGARKWPATYSGADSVKRHGDMYNKEMSILDYEDYEDAKKTYLYGTSEEELNDPDYLHTLGEVIVGNWKVESVWADATSNDSFFKTKEMFEKWLKGEIDEEEFIEKQGLSWIYEDKEDKIIDGEDNLQLFYRIKAFMDAGIPINWF